MSEVEKRLRLLTHEEAAREDRKYWWSRTPEERLRHVEELRVKNYGEDVINQGVQRILSVSDRPQLLVIGGGKDRGGLNVGVESSGEAREDGEAVKIFRHGDLLITPVDDVPVGGRKKGDAILARGEATGHAHRVESREAVELWEFENELYFRLGSAGGEVVHEEHAAIRLEPGNYKVWKQRQYQPEGNSWIED